MAKKRTAKPATSKAKGFSVAKLFIFGAICFFLSKFFANKVAALDYVFAIVGTILFGLCIWKYFRNRKSKR